MDSRQTTPRYTPEKALENRVSMASIIFCSISSIIISKIADFEFLLAIFMQVIPHRTLCRILLSIICFGLCCGLSWIITKLYFGKDAQKANVDINAVFINCCIGNIIGLAFGILFSFIPS